MFTLLWIMLFTQVPAGNMKINWSTLTNFMSCATTTEVCPHENITFWLYTRNTAENPYQLNMQNLDNIQKAPYMKNGPYKVIIHGYTEDRNQTPNKEIRPALLEHGNYNVISIDYNPVAAWPCYWVASKNLRVVANCTAQLVDYMVENMHVPLEDFHFIGFSLGAHVAAQIPNYLKSGRLAHITGLDPAFPIFLTFNLTEKLDKSDADFVDVVHSEAIAIGDWKPCGHVDFYMNGGVSQPGCQQINRTKLVNFEFLCNHYRSTQVYAESVSSKVGFYGQNIMCLQDGPCDTELMGLHASKTARGIYMVETNDQPPYAMGPP